jgi:selT/selW/selH-like putative selenoprotein
VEAELKKSYPDSTVTLTQGSGGIFDVKCDGKLIFSKHDASVQRFPEDGEIIRLIKQQRK